jgi:hypothetical protein
VFRVVHIATISLSLLIGGTLRRLQHMRTTRIAA